VIEGPPPTVIACIEDGDVSSASPNWALRNQWAESYGLIEELDVSLEDWKRLTRSRDSNYPMPNFLKPGREPSHKSGQRCSTRSGRHARQPIAFPTGRPSAQSLSRGLSTDDLSKSPTELIPPAVGNHPTQPTEAPRSPSSASSVCAYASALNSQPELQDPLQAPCQSEAKDDETPVTARLSSDWQPYPADGPLLPRCTQDLRDLWPGPMAGSFPSSYGSQHDVRETTSDTTQAPDLSGTGTRHSRDPIHCKTLLSDTGPRADSRKDEPPRTSIHSQPAPPRRHKRLDTSWRKGHKRGKGV
jgi:hypothetical protein